METTRLSIYNVPATWKDRVDKIRQSYVFTPKINEIYLKALDMGLSLLEKQASEIETKDQ